MRIRWRNFPGNIRREFNRGQISSLIFFKYPRVTFRIFSRLVSTALMKISLFDEQEELNKEE